MTYINEFECQRRCQHDDDPNDRCKSRLLPFAVVALAVCSSIGYYYVHNNVSWVGSDKNGILHLPNDDSLNQNNNVPSKIVQVNDLFHEGLNPYQLNIGKTTNENIRKIDNDNKRTTVLSDNSLLNNNDTQQNYLNSHYVNMPNVAWIMSFSGSGASYPIMYTEAMMNITTASNYVKSYESSISVDTRNNGPYIRALEMDLPNSYILTETHCGDNDDCIDCTFPSYSIDTFDVSCRTAYKRLPNGDISTTTYDSDIPRRIIHFIRNPFDNLVSRMHIANKERISQTKNEVMTPFVVKNDDDNNKQVIVLDNVVESEEMIEEDVIFAEEGGSSIVLFSNDAYGMKQWCQHIDESFMEHENRNDLSFDYSKYSDVPCHTEWFRYIQWHNNAYQLHTERLKVPIHYMYYENYTSNFNETNRQLYEFLDYTAQIDMMNHQYPWIAGKSYIDYYDVNHTMRAYHMIQELALPEVWQLIRHYFSNFIDDNNITKLNDNKNNNKNNSKGKLDENNNDSNKMYNENGNVSKNTDNGSSDNYIIQQIAIDTISKQENDIPKTAKSFNNSKVVWLLSFPNSGTSYTITNTEKVSGSSTGSNYASDWDVLIPIEEESMHGPFFHRPDMPHPEYVLTKTHCTGYCDDCGPEDYVVTSTKQFTNGCATSSIPDPRTGIKQKAEYSSTIPVKIVHLLRNPFDNLVSRLHLEIKKRPEFSNLTDDDRHSLLSSKEGFLSWCVYVDTKFEKEEKHTNLFSEDLKQIFKELPCHADWFRYIQWHNYAISMIDDLDIPTHTMYYEDYDTKYNVTVDTLFNFLSLERINNPLDFIAGKSYHSFFTKENFQAAIRLVQTLATPKSWELIKHYFDDWE